MLRRRRIAIAEPRLVLSDLTGPIMLDGQRVVFDGIRGLANGGALALDGHAPVRGSDAIGGIINIQAQGVAIEIAEGPAQRARCAADLPARPGMALVTGDIRVVQSSYTETITIAALARRAALPVSADRRSGRISSALRLNLAVTTTDDIIVDNNYGRLAAGVNVRIARHRRRAGHGRAHHAARRRADFPGRPHLPHYPRRHFVHRSAAHPSRVQHRRRGAPRRRDGNVDHDADRHARAAHDRSDLRGRVADAG